MSTVVLETFINAPATTCFDLMRDIHIHTQTTTQTNESAVAGVTDGKIGLGQTVTFEGTHFGVKQRFTVEVVEFDRPDCSSMKCGVGRSNPSGTFTNSSNTTAAR